MVYLTISLIVLVLAFWMYCSENNRRFKIFGTVFGSISLIFYALISNIGLISTPAYYIIHNQSKEAITAYYLIFGENYTSVQPNGTIVPFESKHCPDIETEGVKSIWVVTKQNGQLYTLHILSEELFNEKEIVISDTSNTTLTTAQQKTIQDFFTKHYLECFYIYSLLTLHFGLLLLLIFTPKRFIKK